MQNIFEMKFNSKIDLTARLKAVGKSMLLFIILSLSQPVFASPVMPILLTCEHMINPIGVDAANPRFTWKVSDDRQNAAQAAYQIIIGTDSVAVSNSTGNYWQTEKINGANNLVVYQGKALQPYTKYYWCVSVWDTDGKRSKASAVASFETGMLQMSNWKGFWISDEQTIQTKPAGYFRKSFTTVKKIVSARAYISAAGLYELYINGKRIGDHRIDPMYTRFDRRNLYVTHDVTTVIQSGKNAIGVILGNGWYNFQSIGVWDFERAPCVTARLFVWTCGSPMMTVRLKPLHPTGVGKHH